MTEVNDAPSWTAGSSVPFPSEFGYGGGVGGEGNGGGGGESEDWKYHAAEFAKGLAEMSVEFGRGCRDVVKQSVLNEEFLRDEEFRGTVREGLREIEVFERIFARGSGSGARLECDILGFDCCNCSHWDFVINLSLASVLDFEYYSTCYELAPALCVNTGQDTTAPLVKRLYIHPPNASRILLPDGRHLAYQEQGVPADRARFSIISAHPFLSSRLAGIPGLKASVLEEFGIRLVTYDLPVLGAGYWVLGYSGGSMHAWAALRYIPDRVAGAVMVAPMVNPYETRMTKKERSRIWESWTSQRKLMYFLARRFPRFLPYFYRRSFLSGKHGQIDKWLSLTLGKRDRALIEEPIFEEFWQRDVEESVRRRIVKPFVEEAVLLISDWGFSLSELKIQTKPHSKGIIFWLKSMFSQSEPELMGFLGPIHIWQGMDDKVVPPSMTDFVQRLLPGAMVHKLLYDGHFTYFYFCDDCHKQIFTTIFGNPQGPLASEVEDQTPIEVNSEEQEEDNLSASPAA
ncbi:alpha/beta-Hydrolases superfamily protein [Actinidia rufa]|uniref:Alpha/beta-Hydrolases superfamily protein n=1 Tax=Actinidia rufa TaxID=165716 RepID=A0A7J0HBZ0_9ERIC|nr:alpha/beta-Hydrolases superfamily protein [Actinidia rufa]